MTTTRNLRTKSKVTVHRIPAWLSTDRCLVGEIRTTTPARTVFDLAGCLGEEVLRDVIDEVLVKEMCNLPRLTRQLNRTGSRGRPGTDLLRRLIKDFDGRNLLPRSVLERRYTEKAEQANLPRAITQKPVTLNGKRYYIDFAYPWCMVAVELDGWRYHGGRSAWESDIERNNALVAAGWKVLRGTWRSLQDDPHQLIDRVAHLVTPSLGAD
jgi:very-short-patch-repair endonuclease